MFYFPKFRMLDLAPLYDFSRTHCIAICAVLVPVNLLATLQTLLFVGFRRPLAQVRLMAGVSSVYALVLVLHVVTWLAIGVIMAPTYILTLLGCVCIGVNLGAMAIALKRCGNQSDGLVQGSLIRQF